MRVNNTNHDLPRTSATARASSTSQALKTAVHAPPQNIAKPVSSSRKVLEQSGLGKNRRRRAIKKSQVKERRPGRRILRGGNRAMARRARWVCCDEAFSRVNRDLEWTSRTIRHVNRKIEAHKEEWRAWASQAEDRSVQEWYSQATINKKRKQENEELKSIIENQQSQIEHLHHLINSLYMERE